MGSEVIKIANCSGYYGDRLSAAKEMVEGGPIDVLTGDYLAELTMTILFNQKLKRGDDKGYVGTFLKQLKDVAKNCKEKEKIQQMEQTTKVVNQQTYELDEINERLKRANELSEEER